MRGGFLTTGPPEKSLLLSFEAILDVLDTSPFVGYVIGNIKGFLPGTRANALNGGLTVSPNSYKHFRSLVKCLSCKMLVL